MSFNDESDDNVIDFDAGRSRRGTTDERLVVAVVTVTRFIGDQRVHAQCPVFADQIDTNEGSDPQMVPDLAELIADRAVEANGYLDRLNVTRSARPRTDFEDSTPQTA
ncbi:MAG TPA: hypothetical protein VFN10_22570 [Thermoanaerobaculia bacterium]|nr:hypothetical protein [Thermoanaerobaculia bacterium]